MKNVIVLGSTGSIGKSTLDIIRRNPDDFNIIGLSSHSNCSELLRQADEFHPDVIALSGSSRVHLRRDRGRWKILRGSDGLLELAGMPADILVCGISGLAALRPLFACAGKTKRVLLANKEAIISCGELLKKQFRKTRTELISVDSEANSLFQIFQCIPRDQLRTVCITASGGPLRLLAQNKIDSLPIKTILQHPRWSMGKKITIDSATLVNKGFEVMEISQLFDISLKQISIVVHPQSIVHSLIETVDGRMVASLFQTDMRIPISYSLYYPQVNKYSQYLDLTKIQSLSFEKPDYQKFPSLKLALEVARVGKSLPAVFVAADEVAVELYLAKRIRFSQIHQILEKVVAVHKPVDYHSAEEIIAQAAWAKRKAFEYTERGH